MTRLTPEEWKKICAQRFIDRAEVPYEHADYLANETFVNCTEAAGKPANESDDYQPEDCADEEMSYWTD